jgi:protein SCO1/2
VNEPHAPRLWPTLAACGLLVAGFFAAAAPLTGGFDGWTFEALRRERAAAARLHAPAIELRDAQGERLRAFDASGPSDPVYLVDFVYTRCLTVCQTLGAEYLRMQQALQSSGEAGRVRLLSISIDPAHDGPAELAAYARRHRADAVAWRVTAPQEPAAGQGLLRALGVVAVPDGLGGFVHNGAIHLIDGRGRVLGIYDSEQWPTALAAARSAAKERAP